MDDPSVLVRRAREPWSSPGRRGFELEVDLERLIRDYPEVLPGVAASAVAVDQFSVPSGGSVDLVVLERDASITIVECKLAKNAEVKRAVVGQILSYAASLTRLDVDDFLANVSGRLGRDALVAVTPEEGSGEAEDGDEDRFRVALARTLADGAFRLVIAVDRITDELRGIVEYLNARTDDSVEVLALELDLVAHDGVELLVPRVHGLESARRKAQQHGGGRRRSRDVGAVLAAFDEAFADDVRERIQGFLDDLVAAGGQLQGGTGAHPSVIGSLRTPKGVRSLWSITLDPGPLGGPQFFCNVGTWIDVFGRVTVGTILETFATDPALEPIARRVQERGVEKLHRVCADEAFGSSETSQVLRDAMAVFYGLAEGS